MFFGGGAEADVTICHKIFRHAAKLLRGGVVVAVLFAGFPFDSRAQSEVDTSGIGAIWGNMEHYTGDYAFISGKRYEFSKVTIVDTYSLKPDSRGNVRVILDQEGKVAQLFFHGIDMPEVVKRFRR